MFIRVLIPINRVFLDSSDFQGTLRDYYITEPGSLKSEKTLSKLSKVNLFVGPNNSGKSRLLRGLSTWIDAAFDSDRFKIDTTPKLRAIASTLTERLQNEFAPLGYEDCDSIIETLKKISYMEAPLKSGATYLQFGTTFKSMRGFTGTRVKFLPMASVRHNMSELIKGRLINTLTKLADDAEAEIRLLIPGWNDLYNFGFERVYIPSLRGFRPLGLNFDPADDMYAERTRCDYFSDALNRSPSIFTGYNLYGELQLALLGEQSERDFVKSFQEFISKSFFQGMEFQLIPRIVRGADDKTLAHQSRRKEVHVKIGNTEKPIYDLGDGIQQIILLLFQVFKLKDKPALFFIEEPELFLHPSMQRLLIEQFIKSENHQFFLATHSNHLLDTTLDLGDKISVYMVKKGESTEPHRDANFNITNLSSGDKILLRELGVRASSVFLSNCTIWVEGITDRLYIRHWLGLYSKHLESVGEKRQEYFEDLHYSFVEYAGSNITHWSFFTGGPKPKIDVERLCSTLLLIADSDGGTKHERLKLIKNSIGPRFITLPRREIENMLSKKVLVEVLLNNYHELSSNIADFTERDYSDKYLGQFIERTALADIKKKVRKGSYKKSAKALTISDKDGFCDAAIKEMRDWEDLSVPARHLTKKIHSFIVNHNSESV